MQHDHVEPEIRAERDYLGICRAELVRMRDTAVNALATGQGEGDTFDKVQNFAARQFHKREIKALSGLEGVPLFFGRLDFPLGDVYDEIREVGAPSSAPDSDRVYIGRRGVSECFRIDAKGKIVDTQNKLMANARHAKKSDDDERSRRRARGEAGGHRLARPRPRARGLRGHRGAGPHVDHGPRVAGAPRLGRPRDRRGDRGAHPRRRAALRRRGGR